MKTLIHAEEEKLSEAYSEHGTSKQQNKKIIQKRDQPSEKNFGVVDLWKIRGMKKYFNYQ